MIDGEAAWHVRRWIDWAAVGWLLASIVDLLRHPGPGGGGGEAAIPAPETIDEDAEPVEAAEAA